MSAKTPPSEKEQFQPANTLYTNEEKENIIRGVEKYLLLGYDLKNACTMARVAYTTVYTWYTKDDSLRIRLDAAKWSVSSAARANLAKAIKGGDINTSKYWLEKRDKDFEHRIVNEVKGFNFNINEPSKGHKLDSNNTSSEGVESTEG